MQRVKKGCTIRPVLVYLLAGEAGIFPFPALSLLLEVENVDQRFAEAVNWLWLKCLDGPSKPYRALLTPQDWCSRRSAVNRNHGEQ